MAVDILNELAWRDAINQVTDEEGLRELTQKESIGLYAGIDPTGDSMHIGHLIPFMILKRFQLVGHKPVIVVGGGTGSIGDPSGKKSERQLLSQEDVASNVEKIRAQMAKLFGENGFTIVNNYDWLGKMSLLGMLRDYGKLFSINTMLAKDVVASRLEAGISFTEFTYQILQAIDFYELYQREHVRLQIGGSDQWGNITNGVDLIHKLIASDAPAFGLTVPLLLKSDGTKFGKTEGGAVWLDPEKTTPFEFYQFWLNTADADVEKMLKFFTFLTQDEIADLVADLSKNASARNAQRRLAQEVTTFVHGEEAMHTAEVMTNVLFGNADVATLTTEEVAVLAGNVPTFTIDNTEIGLLDLVVAAGFEKSKTAARRSVKDGAVRVNGVQIKDEDAVINPADKYDGKYVIVKRGKKKWAVAVVK
ncbi:tyrosine--tRNA ligase [Weissella sagaensis]|jgi:tyrosyl-tRNA synthetase|uniref:Tyrosine--tRNA ligase n=1 Tax=Weissella sagaensis TaxID=2559928 RepID=A0ABW1RS97_9LACO|nr:tyrosine--tRNA ligase [Weissella sagaensis]KAA8432994.1 tyrosine--tRNA ligase [Weissella paramesenteroides]MBU7568174.1 tyrosine--tRNA ligase [Weissella hellenica]KAA8435918.1 tyrosine--tRNA ligase [Weissella paramesenteroides]QEA57147.1 tyrosine--tRNA ligase [Weissella hellenica]UEG66261.1 tyrosine--tRNA ligase [Weissella hellenica]